MPSLRELIAAQYARGVSVADDAVRPAHKDGRSERMYDPVEPVFQIYAAGMVANGWSVFPQERNSSRRPAMVDGRALKWGEYQKHLPSEAEVASWSAQCPTHNVAIITGPVSSCAFAFDIDVSDRALSEAVQEAAYEVLGRTRFGRVGRPPRVVLVYRHEPDFNLRRRAIRFATPDGLNASGDAIEILAAGAPFTAYGKHHSVGKYFSWRDYEPLIRGPLEAPLVTAAQIDAFIERVAQIRPFFQNQRTLTADVGWEVVDSTGLKAPKLTAAGNGAEWLEDDNGKVTDGREKFLFTLVSKVVWANPVHARDETGVGAGKLLDLIVKEFRAKTVWSDKWDDVRLHTEAREKLSRQLSHARENPDFFSHRVAPAPGEPLKEAAVDARMVQRALPPTRPDSSGPDPLSHIPRASQVSVSYQRDMLPFEDTGGRVAPDERRLIPDRSQIADSVSRGLAEALDDFFGEVYSPIPTGKKRIHVLKAPTGAGKTTKTIRYIAEDPRTKQWDNARDQGGEPPGPIVFLLPTYNNIDELRTRASVLNLDADLDDAELEAQARERGILTEDDVEVRIAELRRDAIKAGLKTMVYKGKLAAGCQMADRMQLLLDAGIGSSGLCKAIVVEKDGEKKEKLCEHYSVCPAIQQRKEIARSHVVFLPHAFFTLNIPDELKQVRCVIADERIFHLFVHTTGFSRTTLTLNRKPPRLTRKEKENGLNAEALLEDRDVAADVAARAFQREQCPAEALAYFRKQGSDGRYITGLEMVRSAKRVCGSALTSGNEITPDTSLPDIQILCSTPTGTEVREEWRFWDIIEERVNALIHDKAHQELADMAGRPWPKMAKGPREMRIQFLIEEKEANVRQEKIRLSWRSTPNWADAPLLLLDASAAPPIISKIFDKRVVKVHEVDAPLNVRTVAVIDSTYSNASIVGSSDAKSGQKALAAKRKERIRQLINAVSLLYGWGRVVCGSSVMVRRAINDSWFGPSNVDWCHFGAMRGLDFAKHHAAAISVGRMEVPIQVIDGLVGALTFDDETPEEPYDKRGDNIGPDGHGLRLMPESQVIKMRGGQDVSVQVPMFPGPWARMVQKQYREEELSQFLGRLRPVYREGDAPVWFAVSKVIPEHVVVDEIVSLKDLVHSARKDKGVTNCRLWEAVRRADGIAHPKLLMAAAGKQLFKNEESAAREMAFFGFGADGKCGMDKRNSWGFTPVALTDPEGNPSWCYVRSETRDIEAHVRRVFMDVLGWDLRADAIRVGTPVRPVVRGGHRAPDWVELEFGDRDARRSKEDRIREKAAVESVRRFPAASFLEFGRPKELLPIEITVRAGQDSAATPEDPGLSDMNMTLDELVSMKSTDEVWHRLKTKDALVTLASPSEDFSQLGEGAQDEVDGPVGELDMPPEAPLPGEVFPYVEQFADSDAAT